MKHYIILLFAIISFSCKAQQTVPLNSDYLPYLKNNNYIKDLNGDLNKFVGTWKWTDPTNSNTYFEIIFLKCCIGMLITLKTITKMKYSVIINM
jgi:hypothetical protein